MDTDQEDMDMDGDTSKVIDCDSFCSLRDLKYNVLVTLQEKERGLNVRPLTLIFEESTVYGQRPGSHEAWLITSVQASTNIKAKSIYKRLIVDKLPMLPRSVAWHF